MGRQIDPQVAALSMGGSVYRTGTAEPMTVAATRDEAQECQHLFHRDLRSDLGKIDGGHDRSVFDGVCRIRPFVKTEQRRGSGNYSVDLRRRFDLGISAGVGVACCWARWAR